MLQMIYIVYHANFTWLSCHWICCLAKEFIFIVPKHVKIMISLGSMLRGCSSWWQLVVIMSTQWKVTPVFTLNCLSLFSWHCHLPEFQGIHSILWTTLHLGVDMNLFIVHIYYFLKTLKFTHSKLTLWWILGSGVRLPGFKFLIYHLLVL